MNKDQMRGAMDGIRANLKNTLMHPKVWDAYDGGVKNFVWDKGKQIEIHGWDVVAEVIPAEIHIKEDGSLNDEPSVTFLMATRAGQAVIGQLSLRMLKPMIETLKGLQDMDTVTDRELLRLLLKEVEKKNSWGKNELKNLILNLLVEGKPYDGPKPDASRSEEAPQ